MIEKFFDTGFAFDATMYTYVDIILGGCKTDQFASYLFRVPYWVYSFLEEKQMHFIHM